MPRLFNKLRDRGFDILALHHAEAILRHDMPGAADEIESVLIDATIPVDELVRGGGGEAQVTQRMRNALSNEHGWVKHTFEVKKVIDGEEREATSHEVDHVKRFPAGTFALEIEWNNKDPFFDRDLENFKRLHADGAISIGAIITRGASMQSSLRDTLEEFARRRGIGSLDDLVRFDYHPTSRQRAMIETASEKFGSFAAGWAHAFSSDKFGEASTHWRKLEDRVRRGVGNPCPLLLLGIPSSAVRID